MLHNYFTDHIGSDYMQSPLYNMFKINDSGEFLAFVVYEKPFLKHSKYLIVHHGFDLYHKHNYRGCYLFFCQILYSNSYAGKWKISIN